jgi:hypothetical protein
MSNTIYPNWFDMVARENFERYLLPECGRDHYKALQIGAFVGHASRWLCKYILTGKAAMLTDVDTWQGSAEAAHDVMDWNDVYNAYIENLYPYHFRRVNHFRMTSDIFFDNLSNLQHPRVYDFAYIDGDHTAKQVRRDGLSAWKYLAVGGILAFDDYEWKESDDPTLSPKLGINQFLEETDGEWELLHKGWQVWLSKTN